MMQPQRPSHHLSDRQMAVLLAMLTAVLPFSVDAYLPAIPELANELNSNIHIIEQSLGSFILGLAFGQLLGGSLSDIKGRKNLAMTGLLIYMAATLGLVLLQTVEQLLALRLLQAVGSGMAVVVVGAVVRDNYSGKQAAQMFALIGIIMMAAPSLAPLIGSLLADIGGWRSIFAFLLCYALLVFMLIRHFLPKHKSAEPLTQHALHQILSRYRTVFRTRPALGFLFFQAASFSSMLVFLTESPFVYMKLFGLSSHQYAWAFGGNIIMMAFFNRTTAWKLKRDSNSEDILRWGIALQLGANLLLMLITSGSTPPAYMVLPLVMLSVGTQGLIVANTQTLFMEHFQQHAGSANAALSASQSLLAAGIAFLTTLLHNGTATVMGSMMFTCTACGLTLLLIFSRQRLFNKC